MPPFYREYYFAHILPSISLSSESYFKAHQSGRSLSKKQGFTTSTMFKGIGSLSWKFIGFCLSDTMLKGFFFSNPYWG